jgi:hypothetical protein
MKVEDIVEVIKACAENGVVEFTMGELNILFSKKDPILDLQPIYVPEEVQKVADKTSSDSAEEDQIRYKQEELELMLLEDPARYEELLKSGDIR